MKEKFSFNSLSHNGLVHLMVGGGDGTYYRSCLEINGKRRSIHYGFSWWLPSGNNRYVRCIQSKIFKMLELNWKNSILILNNDDYFDLDRDQKYKNIEVNKNKLSEKDRQSYFFFREKFLRTINNNILMLK